MSCFCCFFLSKLIPDLSWALENKAVCLYARLFVLSKRRSWRCKATQKSEKKTTNLLPTEHRGCAEEYWPEVRPKFPSTARANEVSKYFVKLLLNILKCFKFAVFCERKDTPYGHFRGKGPYGKISAKEEPVRTFE